MSARSADHPLWCALSRCEAGWGRAHSSETVEVPPERGVTVSRLQLRLWARPGARTHVEVVVGDHDQATRLRVDLTVPQAHMLRRGLDYLLTDAGVA